MPTSGLAFRPARWTHAVRRTRSSTGEPRGSPRRPPRCRSPVLCTHRDSGHRVGALRNDPFAEPAGRHHDVAPVRHLDEVCQHRARYERERAARELQDVDIAAHRLEHVFEIAAAHRRVVSTANFRSIPRCEASSAAGSSRGTERHIRWHHVHRSPPVPGTVARSPERSVTAVSSRESSPATSSSASASTIRSEAHGSCPDPLVVALVSRQHGSVIQMKAQPAAVFSRKRALRSAAGRISTRDSTLHRVHRTLNTT